MIIVLTSMLGLLTIWLTFRIQHARARQRSILEASAVIIDKQRELIRRSIEETVFDARERGYSAAPPDAHEAALHQEEFAEAWLAPTADLIARIDAELGYAPTPRPPASSDENWTRERDGSWTPTDKAIQTLETETEDVVMMWGDNLITRVIKVVGIPATFSAPHPSDCRAPCCDLGGYLT